MTSEIITVDGVVFPLQDFPEFSTSSAGCSKISTSKFLSDLKTKYPTTFSTTFGTDLLHDYKAHVTLQGFPYTTPKAYFAGGEQRAAIKQYADQLLQNGLIVLIASDEFVALSPVFPLKQSADKIRIITDLRQVNKYLVYTPRTIPTTQSILSELSSKKIFSAIDIRKAYQQLPLTGDALGIITEFGSFKFTRVPHGLASAPYWWSEFLQQIISKLPTYSKSVVRYYYDDIIIASEDETEHRENLSLLFALFEENGLSISDEKLQLNQSSVLSLRLRYFL